jgi:hypothetical protein
MYNYLNLHEIMQSLPRLFWALLLAHLLTDFVFQTSNLVREKIDGRLAGYLKHAAVHSAAAIAAVGFWVPGSAATLRLYLVVFGLTAIHISIDLCKIILTKRGMISTGPLPFITDQILHVFTVAWAACLIARVSALAAFSAELAMLRASSDRTLLLLVVYIAVIFGGGYLVRIITKPLTNEWSSARFDSQLNNAGMYIGWLERFLILTALILRSPATAGLILAAKSIARYPEFKHEKFAEYFLIGTLLSICIAVAGGILLLKTYSGSAAFAQ